MNRDLKQILTWVFGFMMMIMLSLGTYNLGQITDGQKKMNETLVTILIQQQDLNRRVTTLESENVQNDNKWAALEEKNRLFWENYSPQRKQ